MTEQQLTPPPAEKKKSWFARHKILSAILAVVVIIVLGSAFGGGADSEQPDTAPDSTSETASSDDGEATSEPTADDEPEEESTPSFYAEKYGTFKTIKKSGTGDGTVTLPDGGAAGIVSMTHNGSANFAVMALDASNQPTGDLLANTIGSYRGVSVYGLASVAEPIKLKITANGDWRVTIKPIAKAKELTVPATGRGDAVFLYNGDAVDWTLKHQGKSNFAVIQYSDDIMPNLMVNEIGSYKGTVPAMEGPSVVTIQADGQWSIK